MKDYTVSGIRNWEKSILTITGVLCRVNHAPAFFLPIDPIIYLAILDNYHLPRKNASFDNIIWHGHLWGGTFQMAVMWETPGYRREWEGAFRSESIDKQ